MGGQFNDHFSSYEDKKKDLQKCKYIVDVIIERLQVTPCSLV